MTPRLRWGFLGTARINRLLLPVIRGLSHHEVVAVASRQLDRAQDYARTWDIPHAEGSYESLLARDDVDVVYVPLPNALHAEWTVRALDAGKHVLCEKPLALTVSEVDAIMAAAQRADRRAAEAFMFRHHAQTAIIRNMLARGDLGDIRLIRCRFAFTLDRPADIRWNRSLGGGVLWDLAVYPVSFARAVLQREPVLVRAAVGPAGSEVDSDASGIVEFGDGTRLVFDCSFHSPYRLGVDIVGSTGELRVPVPFKPGIAAQIYLTRGGPRREIEIAGNQPYEGQIHDMARQAFDGEQPVLPLEDSRANVRVLQALHRSAAEHRWVKVAEVVA